MNQKTGYSTTTYRKQLYQRHLDRMRETKLLYNRVLYFYYQILLNRQELLSLSGFELMRKLEILTVGTREDKKIGIAPEFPLAGFPKLPLYFRRAAINAAIATAKSYTVRLESWRKDADSDKGGKGCPRPAVQFHAAPVFYQGMYRNWEEDSIELKLWTGERWEWTLCRMKGRKLPDDAKILSPSLKVLPKGAELHIPVQQVVSDVRRLNERLAEHGTICAVYLPNQDMLAVCVHMDSNGVVIGSCFLHGGADLKRRKEELFLRRKTGGISAKEQTLSFELRRKIARLNEDCAHSVSRKIVDYVKSCGASILVIPAYKTPIPSFRLQKSGTGVYSWIGRSIINKSVYKAFQEGIVTGTVSPGGLASHCAECGAAIMRYNEGHRPGYSYYGGKLFLCPNGHRGNTAYNAAVHAGRTFLAARSADKDKQDDSQ